MILPDGSNARVDCAKVIGYLLSSSHPDGRGKAAFFIRCGFKVEEWIEFAEPVQGPLALGFGCHFGLGLFIPAPDA